MTLIGIDAGGSSTRAQALVGGALSCVGEGGPANALIPDDSLLERSFAAALHDLPAAGRIAACVAGAGSAAAKDRITQLLQRLRPQSQVRVYPDYAAAFHALPAGTDICVIAGTGSVICSPSSARATGWLVSGGRGWLLGDHGSASTLGRAFYEDYVNGQPDDWPEWVADEVAALHGDADWRTVVRTIHSADAPAAMLAAAAPIVTRLAADGHDHAHTILDEQLARLAQSTVEHAYRLRPDEPVRVGLAGGLWKSEEAITSFRAHLLQLSELAHLTSTGPVDPLVGTLRLASQQTAG
ncbi:N-acetylglucosamine kinase [Allobranchiibius sp. CTAmp26]|uniref:N-acetylglucosamine kinase n=1 Tax=Allobranchiibius sp. CTAmp26 TaxID=2815214 RepID=UPI001AA0EE89|nr:hypothetical protein [Allobranchiibius sp. CTAmp26]MBO1756531.1 hypothetical protein [Allobranchiibius sp. CTAmp26]